MAPPFEFLEHCFLPILGSMGEQAFGDFGTPC
jgi:hypothetical protein